MIILCDLFPSPPLSSFQHSINLFFYSTLSVFLEVSSTSFPTYAVAILTVFAIVVLTVFVVVSMYCSHRCRLQKSRQHIYINPVENEFTTNQRFGTYVYPIENVLFTGNYGNCKFALCFPSSFLLSKSAQVEMCHIFSIFYML